MSAIKLMFGEKTTNFVLIPASVIIGLSLIAGTFIVSQAFYSVKKLSDTLAVTGSAKQQIKSDSVKWHSSFTRNVFLADVKSGYASMKKDETDVQKFLTDNGIDKSQMTISPVFMNEIWKTDQNSPKEYALSQSVEVDGTDVAKITALAKNIQPLIDKGVIFSTQSVEYFTSQLEALRVSLLSDAIKDAKARAEKIAGSSGKKVGAIQSATMGIVQVMPLNSVDISDYGNYDTSSIDKEVMVTVKTVFRLE
jgi:uncharacterized protein